MTLYYVDIFSRADFYNRAEFTDTVRGKALEQGEQEEEIHLHKQDRAGQRVNNKYRRSTHTCTDTHTHGQVTSLSIIDVVTLRVLRVATVVFIRDAFIVSPFTDFRSSRHLV